MHEQTRIALVGTSKHSGAGAADRDHPAAALTADVAVDDREQMFLLQAGARAVYEQCGRLARADVAPPPPCPAEDRRLAPRKLVGPLQNALGSDSWDLLVEFLRQLQATGLVLPPELLPQALSVSDATVREHLLPVVGERGRWLSEFNAEWRWVTAGVGELSGSDHDALVRQWEQGTISERCHAIATLRRSDPAAARQWLEAGIDNEKPDHRARLLSTLEIGLEADDEPLLEARLDDRSEQVRRVAAGMLARLTESALAQRMRQRAEAMLAAEPSGDKRKKIKLVCAPPEKIDKTWERDGVPSKAPAGRGKRAVWTETVLSAVAPSSWSRRFEAEPAVLIDAMLDDDFAQPVLVGWTQAAAAFAAVEPDSASWLRPLWDHWLAVEKRTRGEKGQRAAPEHLQTLLKSMPDAEAALLPVLKSAVSDASAELLGLLPLVPRRWSDAFGQSFLKTARALISRHADNIAYQWATALVTAGRALPRAAFPAALQPWQVAGAESGNWQAQAVTREIDKFKETIQTRKNFYDEAEIE